MCSGGGRSRWPLGWCGLSLRLRFGLEAIEYTKTTVVIVVTVQSASGNRIIGVVVDGVSDVLNLQVADIQPAPDFSLPHIEAPGPLLSLTIV